MMDRPESRPCLKPSRPRLVGVVGCVLLGWTLSSVDLASANHNSLRSDAVGIRSGDNLFHSNNDTGIQSTEYHGGPPFAGDRECPFNYGATVWYKFRARKYGTLRFNAVGGDEFVGNGSVFFDPTLALFRRSRISRPIACNDDAGGLTDAKLREFVSPGRYGIQIGGAEDPPAPVEEGQFNLLANFSRAPVVDARPKLNWEPHGHKTEIDLRLNAERRSKARVRCRGDCNDIKRRCRADCVLAKNELVANGTRIKIKVRKRHEYGRLFTFRFRTDGPALRSRKLRPR